jgi:hypothetical protein
MRAAHQRPDGFSVGVTKTFPVGAERLHAMFAQARQRNRWIDEGTLALRTATAPRTARFDFGDDGSRVVVGITAKGPSKSTAAIQHERLPEAGAVKDMRAFWKERLGVLADLLAG